MLTRAKVAGRATAVAGAITRRAANRPRFGLEGEGQWTCRAGTTERLFSGQGWRRWGFRWREAGGWWPKIEAVLALVANAASADWNMFTRTIVFAVLGRSLTLGWV